MDALTHIVLGAAVWGAACATVPDLDVLIPYGDPVRDFTFHRAGSHALKAFTRSSTAGRR